MQVIAGSDVFVNSARRDHRHCRRKGAARKKKRWRLRGRKPEASKGASAMRPSWTRPNPRQSKKARADLAHHQGEVERLTAALARLG